MLLIVLLGTVLPLQSVYAQQAPRCPDTYLSPQQRIGINVAREEGKEITDYAVEQLGMGWYLDYTWHDNPAHPATTTPPDTMTYLPMVRPTRFTEAQQAGQLSSALAAALSNPINNNPGSTWLLGNEPDNAAQDRQTPYDYAHFYHEAYSLIKRLDPTAQIAIAPITQVTPLRLRYLQMVLDSYEALYGEALPVDVWTVHVYILPERGEDGRQEDRETRRQGDGEIVVDSGIGVPVGLEGFAEEAVHFTQAQHGDLSIFAEQVVTFRRWLAERGYRNTPLYLTEYGILLSKHHGYDDERVRAFYLASTAYLQQAQDEAIGYPADSNRLVQRWAWFSLNFYAFDPDPAAPHGLEGLNGNLFDHGSGAITPLGETAIAFGQRLHEQTVDLVVTANNANPPTTQSTHTVTITNRGDAIAAGFRLRLWRGQNTLASIVLSPTLQPHCGNQITVPLHWLTTPASEQTGASPLRIQVQPIQGQVEYAPVDNTVFVGL